MAYEGEGTEILERVVVSPSAGVFAALPDGGPLAKAAGAMVGMVLTTDGVFPITTPFAGLVVEVVAVDGERLERFQRVAWLRPAA